MITNGDIAVIVGGSILLIIMIMIARNYGIWNMVIYGSLVVLVLLAIFGGGNSGYGGIGFQAGFILFLIYPIFFVISNLAKNYFDKNSPTNNTRYNNRSNNTRTSK